MAETSLDKWQPSGTPIHPYDVYDLLMAGGQIVNIEDAPRTIDEADYFRNISKRGSVVEIDGKRYFQTTTVPFKSTTFKE
jgi:hypothetical protein